MRLATFREAGRARLGAVCGPWMVDLSRSMRHRRQVNVQKLPSDLAGLLNAGQSILAEAAQVLSEISASLPEAESELTAAGVVRALDETQFLPPVPKPGKILCVGLNYPNPGALPAEKPAFPVIFGKFANTLVGHRQPILLPRVSRQVVCEGELALVIGQGGRHIHPEDALDHLAGCTLANDLTASDLENRSSQWMTGKLPDTFTPLGPVLVTMDELPPLDELGLRTYLNGELVLSGSTSQMFFGIPELISYLSGITTLEPGDLILTGSPKGIDSQPASKVMVGPGDRISVEIEAIGRLENWTIAEAGYGS
jgi:2-keto-4-pentenoate hydratase/2-oxohepta-3-ene-1,7-dioic acid hydratase in catechol pathway